MDQPRAPRLNSHNPASPTPVTTSPMGPGGVDRVGLVGGVGLLLIVLGGCRVEGWKAMQGELIRQGHAATVDCLQAERAITGGDELRCEDWNYVRQTYLKPD